MKPVANGLMAVVFTLSDGTKIGVRADNGEVIVVDGEDTQGTGKEILSIRIVSGQSKGTIPWSMFVKKAATNQLPASLVESKYPNTYLVTKYKNVVAAAKSPIINIDAVMFKPPATT